VTRKFHPVDANKDSEIEDEGIEPPQNAPEGILPSVLKSLVDARRQVK